MGGLVLRNFGFLPFCFFGFLVEQHLTAKRWEGSGTAPDSKEMGKGDGVREGGYHIYIYISS